MNIAAMIVALVALLVSVLSAYYARRATIAAEAEAEAARASERRANTPNLVVAVETQAGESGDSAVYSITHEGPIDLDSLVVLRPRASDSVRYAVAELGGAYADEAAFAPVAMGQTVRFVLAIGSNQRLPEFRVRIVAKKGDDVWERVVPLDPPRMSVQIF